MSGMGAAGCRSWGMRPALTNLAAAGASLVPGAIAYWDCTKLSPDGLTLYDQSGNGYHGTLGAGAAKPTATATGLLFGTDDSVTIPTVSAQMQTLSFVFGLAAPADKSTSDRIISGHSATTDIHFGGYTGLLTNEIISLKYDAATSRSGWCDASASIAAGWHTLDLVWDGTTYQIHLDGEQKPVTTVGTPVPFTGSAWKLGASSSGTLGFNDTIGAALAYPFALTADQRARNRAYWRPVMARRGAALA